jgi:uncharacterized protein (DUF697 family)
MSKSLPRLRNPTLDDIKRTATSATPPVREVTEPAPKVVAGLPAVIESQNDSRIAPEDERRLKEARAIVARYRNWTIAAAAAPIPLADAALVSGVQLRMVARLARLYGVPFERVRVVSLLTALFGGWTPYTITTGVAGAAARMAPGIGTLIGIATSVGTSTLATETIGKMFIQHFEDGGTFLDFEPKKYRERLDRLTGNRKNRTGKGA